MWNLIKKIYFAFDRNNSEFEYEYISNYGERALKNQTIKDVFNIILNVVVKESGCPIYKDTIVKFYDLDERLNEETTKTEMFISSATISDILGWESDIPVAYGNFPFVRINLDKIMRGQITLEFRSSKSQEDYGIEVDCSDLP